ncbi:unnamed protein product, partial [Prorocentrum cordatum]
GAPRTPEPAGRAPLLLAAGSSTPLACWPADFDYLVGCQFRILSRKIPRKEARARFTRKLGETLYRKILAGDVVGPRVWVGDDETGSLGDVNMSSPFSGTWPAISTLPQRAQSAEELRKGAQALLRYLAEQQYCAGGDLSAFQSSSDGAVVEFTSYVREPANFESTVSLMRDNDLFAPRFDQRILEAYFEDSGYLCTSTDEVAGDGEGAGPARGIRTRWKLKLDQDD